MPESPILRLFPLKLVVFPGQEQAIHIFEPRYRQLLHEIRHSGEPFGIALIKEGPEAGGGAVPNDIGCAVALRHVQELPDGRFNIVCEGVRRFRVLRLLPEAPYPRAEVEFLDDPDDAEDQVTYEAATDLTLQFAEHLQLTVALQDGWQRHFDLPTHPLNLADFVAARLDVTPEIKQEVLQARRALLRLEILLKIVEIENATLADRLVSQRRQKLAGLGVLN